MVRKTYSLFHSVPEPRAQLGLISGLLSLEGLFSDSFIRSNKYFQLVIFMLKLIETYVKWQNGEK